MLLARAEPGETGGGACRGDTDLDLGNSPTSWGVRYVLQMETSVLYRTVEKIPKYTYILHWDLQTTRKLSAIIKC